MRKYHFESENHGIAVEGVESQKEDDKNVLNYCILATSFKERKY